MKLIADLHLHSHYARATSKELNLANLEKYARIKGLGLLGTGDFQHPKWRQEVKSSLSEDESGILRSSTGFPFIWQTEISLVYTQGGKGRRVHHIILVPGSEVAEQASAALGRKGRLDYDGRPIFGFSSIELVDLMMAIFSSIELVDLMMAISPDIEIIPAHAWTPWFSVFGSNSGFNSIKECFQDRADKIHAIETGLSSDPPMNWRISGLDRIALISNSDSHSYWPWRIGREANIFDLKELSYKAIIMAIRNRELAATIEVDPAYGKYHYDGHRLCGVCMTPKEAIGSNNICPKCRKKLTIGVLHRVEELADADRPEGYKPENAVPFYSLIPLSEIIAEVSGSGIASNKVWKAFNGLISRFGTEFSILLDAPYEELQKTAGEKIAAAIIANREGKLTIKPGYDGEYGKPVFEKEKAAEKAAKPGKEERQLPKKHAEGISQKGLGEYF
ncbi:DNA helicase UvrD [Candidatus Woesearchaeota archaeon]|nr:DNA helicase UvrD [Candidatus Woesearchaeota archaeon]